MNNRRREKGRQEGGGGGIEKLFLLKEWCDVACELRRDHGGEQLS